MERIAEFESGRVPGGQQSRSVGFQPTPFTAFRISTATPRAPRDSSRAFSPRPWTSV